MYFVSAVLIVLSWFTIIGSLHCHYEFVACQNKNLLIDPKKRSFMQWTKIFTSSSNYDSDVTNQLMRAKSDNDDEFDFPLDSVGEQKLKDIVIRENFYKHLSNPTRKVCKISKRFGGHLIRNGVSVQTHSNSVVYREEFEPGSGMDGTKFICLDELYKDLISQRCLIYSFGLSDDWTFEENMANFGCKVRAFDPTVDEKLNGDKNNNIRKNLIFSKQGIYHDSKSKQDFGGDSLQSAFTLEDTIERFNDSSNTITVLKMDVEGEEMWTIPQILETDVLKNVKQIHIEVHVNEKNLIWTTENTHFNYHHYLSSFMKAIQKTVSVYGFRLIFYGPNELIERHLSQGSQYYSLFDIVLCKP